MKGMVQNGSLSKSIMNASWGKLVQYTPYKASSAGGRVVLVDPRRTTQECANCGLEVRKPLWVRVHRCSNCGFTADRDLNPSLVIKKRAVPAGSGEVTPVEMRPLPLLEGQALSLKQEAHVLQPWEDVTTTR